MHSKRIAITPATLTPPPVTRIQHYCAFAAPFTCVMSSNTHSNAKTLRSQSPDTYVRAHEWFFWRFREACQPILLEQNDEKTPTVHILFAFHKNTSDKPWKHRDIRTYRQRCKIIRKSGLQARALLWIRSHMGAHLLLNYFIWKLLSRSYVIGRCLSTAARDCWVGASCAQLSHVTFCPKRICLAQK